MKNIFKNIFFSVCFLFTANMTFAQVGLEGIEVETYYVSTPADQAAWGLPAGAKTYRVYANLQTGWSLQSLYGGPVLVGNDIDSLVFFSSTNFWNDANGGTFPQTISNSGLSTGAAMLDSYLSFGGGGGTRRGILRSLDTDGGTATPLTGTAGSGLLSANDGRFNTGVALSASGAGFDPDPDVLPLGVLNNNTIVGNRFSTSGLAAGAAVIAGGSAATGPGADNRVLLGQFTTAGTFGYHINIQINQGATVEKWVASSPVLADGEFTMPSLILTPNTPPVVAITTPATNISVVAGTSVALEASATDAGGSIAQVEFFNGATSLFVDNSFPYQHTFTPTATANITAVATDNLGATTTSLVRTISVGANQAPVIIVAAAPSTVVVGGSVALTSPTLTDTDGTIVSVQYYYRTSVAGAGTPIGSLLTALPFATSWTSPATAGVYYIYGVATDNLGLSTTSLNVTVTVNANTAPSISIAIPTPSPITAPAPITINATAADSDGTVSQVEFFVNGVSVNVDNATPFTYNWASTPGGKNFTAVATDNNGATTTSNTVAIFVIDPAGAPYRIANVSQNCVAETTCLPIVPAIALDNVIGYDVIIGYNNAKIEPTGNVIVRNNYVDSTLVEVIHSIESTAGRLNFSAYFKSNAPSTTEFNGVANNTLFCVEFAKLSTFASTDTVSFNVIKLQESYANGVVIVPADAGTFSTYRDSLFDSSLKFWADNSPIKYVAGTNLVTNIYGTDGACANKATTGVTPDANGNFVHNINKGRSISIERDIANTTSVQSVVNGFDALQVRKLLINDVTFRPSVYQILAMDVNLDGVISAGDASQINQRSVLILGEYKQAWNYQANGLPILPAQPSKDWLFLQSAITSTAPFGISTTFPNDNGVGFSKNRVPVLAFCNPTPTSDFSTCPIIGDEIYKGIMLGDVNGSYQNIAESTTLRTAEKIVFDLSKAIVNSDNTTDVPVSFASGKSIFALDFALSVNEDRMTINSTVNAISGIQALSNYNVADKTLRFTSNSLVEYAVNQSIVYVRFNTNGTLNKRDFATLEGYLNGDLVDVEVNETVSGTVESSNNSVSVFPNPTTGRIFVNPSTDVNVQLFDINGKFVTSVMNLTANQNNEINVEALNNGVYMMKVYNGTFATTKKVFVTK